MKVLVKKDSATLLPVDCGEGEPGKAKLQALVNEHGGAVMHLDGSQVVAGDLPAPVKAKAAKRKAKAPKKAKARKSKKGIR